MLGPNQVVVVVEDMPISVHSLVLCMWTKVQREWHLVDPIVTGAVVDIQDIAVSGVVLDTVVECTVGRVVVEVFHMVDRVGCAVVAGIVVGRPNFGVVAGRKELAGHRQVVRIAVEVDHMKMADHRD